MEHRLAALFGRPIWEMKATLPVSEWRRWLQYWNEEPWGPWRDNAHAGLVASTIASVYRKKGAKPFTFDQFMLRNSEIAKADEMAALPGRLKAMARPLAEREAEMRAKRLKRKEQRKRGKN